MIKSTLVTVPNLEKYLVISSSDILCGTSSTLILHECPLHNPFLTLGRVVIHRPSKKCFCFRAFFALSTLLKETNIISAPLRRTFSTSPNDEKYSRIFSFILGVLGGISRINIALSSSRSRFFSSERRDEKARKPVNSSRDFDRRQKDMEF